MPKKTYKYDKNSEWTREDRFHPKNPKVMQKSLEARIKHRKGYYEQQSDEQDLYELSYSKY